jgi:hypothetical protein
MADKSRSTLNRVFKVTAVIALLFWVYEVVMNLFQVCICTVPNPNCCPPIPSWYYPILLAATILLAASVVGIIATRQVTRVGMEKSQNTMTTSYQNRHGLALLKHSSHIA